VSGPGAPTSDCGTPHLELSCRQLGDDVFVIAVAGELDMATAPQLRAYLMDKTAPRPSHVVLNLAGVTFLASHGLGVLIDARDGHADIHGELHLTGVTPKRQVARTLDLTGLTPLFDIHDDEAELLRQLTC